MEDQADLGPSTNIDRIISSIRQKIKKAGPSSSIKIRQVFESIDKNGSNTIDKKELSDIFKLLNITDVSDSDVAVIFDRFDTDRDNSISFFEFLDLLGQNEDQYQSIKDQADLGPSTNIDRIISNIRQKIEKAGPNSSIKIRQVFESIDKNGSNTIDKKELSDIFKLLNITDVSDSDVAVIFDRFDADRDNSISFLEFLDLLGQNEDQDSSSGIEELVLRIRKKTEFFDISTFNFGNYTDRSGIIDKKSLESFLKELDVEFKVKDVEVLIKKFSRHNMKALTYPEFLELIEYKSSGLELDDSNPFNNINNNNNSLHSESSLSRSSLHNKKGSFQEITPSSHIDKIISEIRKKIKKSGFNTATAIKKIFEGIDNDGSYTIDKKELSGAFKLLNITDVNDTDVAIIFDKFDIDRDNSISYLEFLDLLGQNLDSPIGKNRQLIKNFDSEGIGEELDTPTLTAEEVKILISAFKVKKSSSDMVDSREFCRFIDCSDKVMSAIEKMREFNKNQVMTPKKKEKTSEVTASKIRSLFKNEKIIDERIFVKQIAAASTINISTNDVVKLYQYIDKHSNHEMSIDKIEACLNFDFLNDISPQLNDKLRQRNKDLDMEEMPPIILFQKVTQMNAHDHGLVTPLEFTNVLERMGFKIIETPIDTSIEDELQKRIKDLEKELENKSEEIRQLKLNNEQEPYYCFPSSKSKKLKQKLMEDLEKLKMQLKEEFEKREKVEEELKAEKILRENADNEIQKEKKISKDLKGKLEESSEKLNEEHKQYQAIQKKLEKAEKTISELEVTDEKHKQEMKEMKEIIDSLRAELEKKDDNIKQIERKLEKDKTSIKDLEAKIKKLLEDDISQLDTKQLSSDLKNAKALIEDLKTKNSDLSNSLRKETDMRLDLERKSRDSESLVARLTEEIADLNPTIKNFKEQIKVSGKQVDQLRSELETAKEKIADLEEKNAKLFHNLKTEKESSKKSAADIQNMTEKLQKEKEARSEAEQKLKTSDSLLDKKRQEIFDLTAIIDDLNKKVKNDNKSAAGSCLPFWSGSRTHPNNGLNDLKVENLERQLVIEKEKVQKAELKEIDLVGKIEKLEKELRLSQDNFVADIKRLEAEVDKQLEIKENRRKRLDRINILTAANMELAEDLKLADKDRSELLKKLSEMKRDLEHKDRQYLENRSQESVLNEHLQIIVKLEQQLSAEILQRERVETRNEELSKDIEMMREEKIILSNMRRDIEAKYNQSSKRLREVEKENQIKDKKIGELEDTGKIRELSDAIMLLKQELIQAKADRDKAIVKSRTKEEELKMTDKEKSDLQVKLSEKGNHSDEKSNIRNSEMKNDKLTQQNAELNRKYYEMERKYHEMERERNDLLKRNEELMDWKIIYEHSTKKDHDMTSEKKSDHFSDSNHYSYEHSVLISSASNHYNNNNTGSANASPFVIGKSSPSVINSQRKIIFNTNN